MSLKITGGQLKTRSIKCPKQIARPTKSIMRQALFNILQTSIEKSLFLDLFAGSGIMGIEAISRGAMHATFIDNSPIAIQVVKENLKKLHIEENATVILADVHKGLKRLKQKFSITYLDPPYRLDNSEITTIFSILVNVMENNGSIFLERKASSKDEIIQIDKIEHLKDRKFGNSILHQYIVHS